MTKIKSKSLIHSVLIMGSLLTTFLLCLPKIGIKLILVNFDLFCNKKQFVSSWGYWQKTGMSFKPTQHTTYQGKVVKMSS